MTDNLQIQGMTMTDSTYNEHYEELLARLGISFTGEELLLQALTHRSFQSENAQCCRMNGWNFWATRCSISSSPTRCFEPRRLVGGELTKAKAAAVEERSLEQMAREWDLGPFVRISHGEEGSGGRNRRALLADAVEALIGAYFLDQGLEICRELSCCARWPTCWRRWNARSTNAIIKPCCRKPSRRAIRPPRPMRSSRKPARRTIAPSKSPYLQRRSTGPRQREKQKRSRTTSRRRGLASPMLTDDKLPDGSDGTS